MDDNWMPHPSNRSQIETLAAVLATVVEGREAVYVSSPLTSGPRALEWHAASAARVEEDFETGSETFRRVVVGANREAASTFVHRLRSEIDALVIDPTALPDVPGWGQPDYRYFWGEVIRRYASKVVFRGGWMYSNGCVYEFLIATESGATTVQEDLSSLNLEQGIALISGAIEETTVRGLSNEVLQEVLTALNKLRSATRQQNRKATSR